ncbi:DUF4838 domain-containing protein [Desulfobacter sp. UBA2225]|uniref:DUF4838 domain-containing protein n=1 Tax=Desulfobacter sp. UBA2225 TaxID=1961413 RepID=UPI00257A78E1|nr:DUF4838 domain-containing protein [Desulfobacter sp. UBA2225]
MQTGLPFNFSNRLILSLTVVCVYSFYCLQLFAGQDQPKRVLIEQGKSRAKIQLSHAPSALESKAAAEIQRCVRESTGATLPIISAPETTQEYIIKLDVQDARSGESSEQFSVFTTEFSTEISGGSPLAVFYGACAFLEEVLGVRWYLPGTLGEIIPKHDTIVVPHIERHESPDFPMRWVGNGTWMLRNRQNHCKEGFWIYPGIYHTQNAVLPHDVYFSKNPEYFALINGNRSRNPGCKLCYSNPNTVREVAKNLGKMLDQHPEIDLLSLSPTDRQMWCECKECRAMDEQDAPNDQSKSRRSLLFYNAVAAELRKTHPDAQLLLGAYDVYNWPPRDTSIKIDPMLSVIICHYEDYCMAHSVADTTCPKNRQYQKIIKSWQNLGCQVYFYEYYWKTNWLDLPWPIVHSVSVDIPWYKKNGCQGVYTQYNEDCIWSQFPVHYVAARLLWDVDMDVNETLERMYADLFGKAATDMKAYYSLMEKQMATCGKHFPGRGATFGPHIFTDEVRKALRMNLNGAVQKNDDSRVAQRLHKVQISLEYVERLMSYLKLKQMALNAQNGETALKIAKQALDCGEALREEIRSNREKWGGVVSKDVVGRQLYLSKELAKWRNTVRKRWPAIVD